MSRLYPKLGGYHGLSSDDDEDSGGLFDDRHAQHSGRRSPGRHRGQNKGHSNKSSSSSRHSYSTQNSVSLEDFDKDYVDMDDEDHTRKAGHGDQRRREKSGGPNWTNEIAKLLLTSSKWKLAFVGLLLGLLCAVAHQSYIWIKSERSSSDNLLKCWSEDSQEPCLTPSQLKPALLLADTVRHHIHKRAGQFECGVKSAASRDITLEEVKSTLFPEHTLNSEEVVNMFALIQHNPHWGIRWLDELKNPISDQVVRFPSPNDILSSTRPSRTVSCWLRQSIYAVWDQLKMLFMIVVGVVVVFAVVRWYVHTKETEMRSVYIMVDKILDVLKQHHENTRRNDKLLPYLAIIHVRDMLIPPSERRRSVKIWEKACQWLVEHESRVRVENQRIAGEDFDVWRWIQVDPPQTEIPWSTGGMGGGERGRQGDHEGGGQDATDGGVVKKPRGLGDWRGTAFEDYPPGVDVKVAPPAGSPSPFIRLKNMFEATRYMDDEMAKEIENSVLERCSPHGDVVHVYIDRRSPYGCVYLKMDSLQSAQGAYKALHGGWYRGKLVTAKYIPEAKYYKWFPMAAAARVALTPS